MSGIDLGALSGRIIMDATSGINSLREFDTSVQSSGANLNTFTEGVSTKAKLALSGLAASIGAFCALAVNTADDLKKALNTLQTQTGATATDMEGFEQSLKNIYTNNYGENFEDIAQSMALIQQQTQQTGEELEQTTESALAMRDTFGMEIPESIRATDMMMKQFGLTSEQAYSMIAQGAQSGLDKNENLLDSINEYSVHFKQLGFDAEEMFNMFANGAKTGVFDVDKLGDAMKEFGIRVQDGSNTSIEAFEALGFNAAEMQVQFAQGGETAREAFSKVATALVDCDDKIAQNVAGVGLFGTMYEDMGVKAITALTNVNGKLSAQTDTLNNIKSIKYDDLGNAFVGIGRQLEMGLIVPLGEKLLPKMNEFANWIDANMDGIVDVCAEGLDMLGDSIIFLTENTETLLPVLAGATSGFIAFKTAIIAKDAVIAFNAALAATTTQVGGLNRALAVVGANPVVMGITAVAAAIGFIATANAQAKKTQEELNQKIIETIQLKNDMSAMSSNDISAMQAEQTALQGQIATHKQLGEALKETSRRIAELSELQLKGTLSESQREELSQLESKYRKLGLSIADCTNDINENYGSIENGRNTLEAFEERLENTAVANKLLSETTNATAKKIAEEGLALQTSAAQAKGLADRYETLTQKQKLTGDESRELKKVKDTLIGTMGQSIVTINKETGQVEINKQALNSQINVTNNLAGAKLNCVSAFNRGNADMVTKQRDATKAIIEMLKTQLVAFQTVSNALGNISNPSSVVLKGIPGVGDAFTTPMEKSLKSMINTKEKAVSEMDNFLSEVNKVSADAGSSVASAAQGAGEAIEGAGATASAAAAETKKDVLDAAIETFAQKKQLGEMSLLEEIGILDGIKKNNSDTAEHIIKVNSFAQEQLIDNINQRKEQESINVAEEIKLYEHAKESYCINAADKAKFNSLITETILGDIEKLTEKEGDMGKNQLIDLMENLEKKKILYENNAAAIKEINEKLLDAQRKINSKELEETEKHWGNVLEVGERISDNLKGLGAETCQSIIDSTYDAAIKNINEYYTERDKRVALMTDGTEKNIVQLEKEVSATQKATDTKIKLYQQEYKAKCSLIDEEKDEATKAIQAQIDAIDKAKEQESRQQNEIDYKDKMAGLYEKLGSANEEDQQSILEEIQKAESDRQKRLLDQQRNDKKESLREEMERIREEADEKKKSMEVELEEKQANLEKQRDAEIEYLKTVIDLMQQQVDKKAELEKLQTQIKEKELLLQSEKLEEETKKQTKSDLEQLKIQEKNLANSIAKDTTTLKNFIPVLQNISDDYGQVFLNGFTSTENDIKSYVDRMCDYMRDSLESAASSSSGGGGSHRTGLRSVPYDDYNAILHRGEMVLTQPEADRYRDGQTNSSKDNKTNIVQNFYGLKEEKTAFAAYRETKKVLRQQPII